MKTGAVLELLLYHLTLFVPIPVTISILLFSYYYGIPPSTTTATKAGPTVFKKAAESRAIIAASRLPETRKQNQLTPHEARARENQTLQRVFGIQNAFTTTDTVEARAFVGEARGRIRVSAVEWDGLSCMLSRMVVDVEGALASEEDDDGIGASGAGGAAARGKKAMLAPMVRALALKTSLAVLFEMKEDVCAKQNKHLVDLGNIIHSTWMGMKSGNEEEVLEFKDNHILRDRLSAVFNNAEQTKTKTKTKTKGKRKIDVDIDDPASNPLNWILPSFETL
ncbi:hypothetical protein BJY00DRAFT_319276 [Aspergillus carlsbadensis]|nr:hypothetical protein BJY00DRAFT_319276 [Aspergillus carlsbadensis]